MKRMLTISALVLTTMSAGAFAGDRDAVVGAMVGGGAGALIGHSVNGRDGAMVGGALGALAGVAIATSDRDNDRADYRESYRENYREPQRVVVYERRPVVRERVVVYQPRPVVVYREAPRVIRYERVDWREGRGPRGHGNGHGHRSHYDYY